MTVEPRLACSSAEELLPKFKIWVHTERQRKSELNSLKAQSCKTKVHQKAQGRSLCNVRKPKFSWSSKYASTPNSTGSLNKIVWKKVFGPKSDRQHKAEICGRSENWTSPKVSNTHPCDTSEVLLKNVCFKKMLGP